MKSIIDRFSQNKYKILMVALLGMATVFAVVVVEVHQRYSATNDYPSLLRNLFLAWIPLVFAVLAYVTSWSRWLLFLVVPGTAFVWLIFFPNAPYMLTEFQHLRLNQPTAPLWLDIIMLIWCAWIGLLLGIVSLHLMQEVVAKAFHPAIGWLFALAVTVMGSAGIYLGRYLRWNSWDILQDPLPIARDVWGWFRNPTSNLRAYGFTILYTLLFLFVYLAFHFFGKMLQERSPRKATEGEQVTAV